MKAHRHHLIYAAVVAGLCLAVFLLYFFPPTETRFYPRCIFHAVTGLECPGCGSLRAAHSVLHGDFAMAFRLNPLLFVLLPLAGLTWVVYRPAGLSAIPAKWIWALLGVIITFGVLRNLPLAPFSYFNP
jgi:hypothetical protein